MDKHTARQLADLYDAPVYHSELTFEERRQQYGRWVLGAHRNDRVIVATSALGVGLDYAHVVNVVIVGDYATTSLVQKIGRGGRAGQPFIVHMLWSPDLAATFPSSDVWTWAREPGCLVAALIERVDERRARACTLNTSRQPCSNCART
jgi:superfamily II DNA helicase RecQ